jgi:cystathionine beta-lyase
MEGMRLVLEQLAPDGPVIVPTPVYPPFLALVRGLGRELLTVPMDPDAERAELDLNGIRAAVAAGGRALLLCHPHNPVGRSWTAAELAALRDIVEPAGVHVVSDEIHAPLVHPGVDFVPYATVASPGAPVSTLASATKAFSMPGLRCAFLVSHRTEDHDHLSRLPYVLNHGLTMLGQVAARAAYEEGEPWLDAVRERIAANQALFTGLVAEQLPRIRIRPSEATYLSWLDLRALRLDDPVGSALRHGVRIDGQDFGPGGQGHVRVNLATSTERVEQIAARLSAAWS